MLALDKKLFAQNLLNETYDLSVLAPIDEQAAVSETILELEDLLALNNASVLEKRHQHFQISGSKAEDYKERLFEVSSSKQFFAGIRHAGQNPDLPFVQITANFNIEHGQNIAHVLKVVQNEFKIFNPKYFSYWTKPAQHQAVHQNQFEARRYVAAKRTALNLSSTASAGPYHLAPIKNESYWDWYKSEYQIFHAKNPNLKTWVPSSNRGDLERYRSQGLLFHFYYDEQLVGLIGGENIDLLGLKGLYMGEMLIADRLKGMGLAVEMQKAFLAQVVSGFSVVWGTIDARNAPSTQTALRIGRKPMRSEIFFSLK